MASTDLMSASCASKIAVRLITIEPMSTTQHPSPPEATIDDVNAELMTSRLGRIVYGLLGFLFLGLGIAGYFVPVLPGTVFILMAAWAFFRSNERMYRWVLNHPRFGPTIRNYRAGYGIKRRTKIYAISLTVISVGLSAWAVDGLWLRVFLVALASFGIAFILTRPTTENVLARAS